MGKTISFAKGKGSTSHNNRDFIAENVDRDRTAWNVDMITGPNGEYMTIQKRIEDIAVRYGKGSWQETEAQALAEHLKNY